jgi:tetratricopeptide (TPR) repeat protein
MSNENPIDSVALSGRKRNLITYISIAISILLLSGLSYLMLQPQSLPHIASKFYQPPIAQDQLPNLSAEDSLYHIGTNAFAHKKWEKAITAFNQISITHPLHLRIMYYIAHAFVGIGEYDKALALLNSQELNNGEYTQQTEWSRILVKMFLNKPKEEIVPDLKAFASEPHLYYCNEAKEILKQMKVKR